MAVLVMTDIDITGLTKQHELIFSQSEMESVFGSPNSGHEGITWEGTIDGNRFTIHNGTTELWSVDAVDDSIIDLIEQVIFS